MNYNENIKVNEYLCRFEQIFCQMANKMTSQQVCGNITIDFIECMIPHHQAAIYMCENLLRYTSYRPLQKIAGNIIKMQTDGIEQMREISKTTPRFLNLKSDVDCYFEKYFSITQNMLWKMSNAPKCLDINLNFVNEMIPHHEGAIEMCENLLKYCIDSRLREIADSIIMEQSNGVKELKEIKNALCMH